MGLAPLAGTGPLCPDRQTLGGRRNARRRPPRKNLLTTGVFKRTPGPKARGRPCAAACSGEKERCLLRQTANYQLSQWDAEDRILREDFNRDNEKLDAAVAAAQAGAVRFLTGSYTGDGSTAAREFHLGARPKFLLLCRDSNNDGISFYQSLFAAQDFQYTFMDGGQSYSSVLWTVIFTDTGFTLQSGETNAEKGFNRSGKSYRYLALCQ